MLKPKHVDEYIAAAPKALEKISYGMPYYGYKGRFAYFRLSKKHIGLYIPPQVISEHII